jgi:hypothetical protein
MSDIEEVRHCREANAVALARISHQHPREVVLAGAWAVHDWKKIAMTLRALDREGIERVDIVGPFPEWKHPLPRTLINYVRHHSGRVATEATVAGMETGDAATRS